MKKFENIAILIDAENVSYKHLHKIIKNMSGYGKISVKRIYSDWTSPKRAAWIPFIHEFALTTIQQFPNIDSKNVSDFALVIDAMDLLYEGIFDCFCIVSSDSDFTQLAQKIKEKGKTVIGFGEKKANKTFINACDKFIYLNEIVIKPVKPKEVKTDDALSGLIDGAIENLTGSDGWVKMVKIVPYLKQIKPDFDLSNYQVNGKHIKQLKKFFTDNQEYELDQDNTMVKKVVV
jgi:uncharacterized protein (TIGR00288 family)